ncbi:MAG: acyltransferase family protein [Anaerolineaceae bacterium]|nr:acyltransferase family protein [Anaerolineaceae bacterium]
MARRLLVLNGLAAFAIAMHHAAAYGLQAMFGWHEPDYTLIGSASYHVTMFIRILVFFAVPAFFFVSGFFIGIMGKGDKAQLKWTTTMPRIKVLVIPFIIWTIIRLAIIPMVPTSFDDVFSPYFFIPVLVQFYLIAPLIVSWAKARWKLLLFVTGFLQISLVILSLFRELGITVPGQQFILGIPRWIFIMWPFWFPFGVVTGIHLEKVSKPLVRVRWLLLGALLLLPFLSTLEYQAIANYTEQVWLGPTFGGVARTLYALAFILCFIAFDRIPVPFFKELTQLGTKSLGIYMGNIPAIYVVAVLIYHLIPWILDNQLIYQTVLIAAGLGGPLLLMTIVRKSMLRPLYRYMFG